MFCKKCGGKLESYASHCAFCGTPVEKYDTQMNYVKEEHGESKKHMTTGKWIGFYLLPLIPLVGGVIQLVLIFKWAFGKHDDLTLKGFARAELIMSLFAIVLLVSLVAVVILNPDLFNNMAE